MADAGCLVHWGVPLILGQLQTYWYQRKEARIVKTNCEEENKEMQDKCVIQQDVFQLSQTHPFSSAWFAAYSRQKVHNLKHWQRCATGLD